MKFLKFLVVLIISITGCMNFTSCSKEDEPGGGNSGTATVNPATVFTNGIPKKVSGLNITVNNDGFVSTMTDGMVNVSFTYPLMSRSTESDVIINVDNKTNDEVYTVNVSLNRHGYSEYWKTVWDDGDIEERWFEYNADNQVKKIKISTNYGGNGTIEYSYENGNIVGVKMSSADGGTMKLTYGNTPIKNTGSIMLFQMFGIEDTATQYAYYAGLLGKATLSLPLKCESSFDDETSVENYSWTVNDKGLPTKLTTEYVDLSGSYTEDTTFEW